MCGLTGFWDTQGNISKDELTSLIKKMSDQITNRGPDSSGTWCNDSIGIAFGHRRLSIVDLSESGNQPMLSSSGQLVLSYNGEIYNTSELRSELKKVNKNLKFRGDSDTEVLLEAFELWGTKTTCERLIGMFAISLWDNEQKKLYLIRDRLGIKPLYWGYSCGVLFFGSQPKSFIPHPKWHPEMDPQALTSYFRFNYIPSPSSIFKGIQKLVPGTILSFDSKGNQEAIQFWSFEKIALEGLASRYQDGKQSEELLINELEILLKDAVKRHAIADVPLGAFLSGGIDSSTVVALIQSQVRQPIKTFSIGFYENSYDEAKYAAKIAKHLGTNHTEFYLDSNLAQKIITDIPNWYDEPFADPSQIPTFIISKLAKQQVTVSLSGDGGDELFAGYDRYFRAQTLWQKTRFLPNWLNHLTATSILNISTTQWDNIFNLIPYKFSSKSFGHELHKLAKILKCPSSEHFYRKLVSRWECPEELVLIGKEFLSYPWNSPKLKSIDHFIERMQYIDTLTYLPDYILAKVDRASMAVGLEVRVPILDHRVVEFAWKLPLTMKCRHGQGKWLLKQVLYRHVPEELVNRPKMGFDIPLDHWLRGPLREWAEYLLDEKKLKSAMILNPSLIIKIWQEHLSGKRNRGFSLWSVLMFQTWKEHWKI